MSGIEAERCGDRFASASTVAALSFAMISFVVPFGAQKPNQPYI